MTMLTRLLNSSSILGLATYEGEGAGSAPPPAGGEAAGPPAGGITAEPSAPPAGTQSLNPQVGSTADPEGQIDETADWVVDAFSEMQRPVLDDVIHSPPPVAPPPPQNPAVTPPVLPQATQPPAPVQPPTAPPTATPVTAQPAPPTLTAQPPPTAQLPGGTVPQPQTPQTAAPQAVPPDQVFDQLGQAIAANKDALAQQLATAVYSVPQAELDRLGLTPEQGKFISSMMAQVQVQATGSIMRLFTQQMPNYVQGLLQRNSTVQEGERQFWADNTHLNPAEHSKLAIEVGTMYRKLNPQASRADFNKFVGDYVGMQVGKVRGVQQAAPPGHQVASLPPVQTPGRVVRPNGHIPYSPAGSNNAPPGALPAPQDTEWGRMMDQIAKMDQGFFDR